MSQVQSISLHLYNHVQCLYEEDVVLCGWKSMDEFGDSRVEEGFTIRYAKVREKVEGGCFLAVSVEFLSMAMLVSNFLN